jgi:3-methyladenine DNA glycosylase/8-oxoguanine DNA glycosylase
MSKDGVSAFIAKSDPAFAPLVKTFGELPVRPPADTHFVALLRAIVFQQLAGKAAMAIYGRVAALFDGEPTPEALLKLKTEQLRGAGLSGSKTTAVQDLAAKCTDGTVPLDDIDELTDADVVTRLVQVRGIGRWTAEMFLMFQLDRPDVWPIDDYGVRNGYARIHKLERIPTPKELAPLGDVFKPYRSTAARYCWRAVDATTPD